MADAVTGVLTALIWIMVLGGLGIGGIILYLNSKFKYFVRVRKIVNNKTLIIDDKARLIKNPKSGVEMWKLRKLKKFISIPPDDCLDTTAKGKIVYECYMSGDGNFLPIRDNFRYREFKQKHADTFQPVLTQERSLLFDQYEKASEYIKNKNEAIMKAVLLWGPPIILVALILILAPEAINAISEAFNSLNNAAAKFGEVADKMDIIINNKQTILGAEINQGNLTIPN